MEKTIILLTKSYKKSPRTVHKGEQGYCVAGIDAETGKWIRLVAEWKQKRDESLIDEDLSDKNKRIAKPLDLIQVNVLDHVPVGCQVENWLLDVDTYYINILEHVSLKDVFSIHPAESPEYAYVDASDVLTPEEVDDIDHSLIIIPAQKVTIHRASRGKRKVSFIYNGNKYEAISMTDPEYYPRAGVTLEYAFLVVSLPHAPWENGYFYKFVAKIFEVTRDEYDCLLSANADIDYSEIMHLGEAYDRYSTVLSPLIVAAPDWFDDYCFAVKDLSGQSARGIAFLGGEFYKNRIITLNKLVHIYNGPSVVAIKEYMNSHGNEG